MIKSEVSSIEGFTLTLQGNFVFAPGSDEIGSRVIAKGA